MEKDLLEAIRLISEREEGQLKWLKEKHPEVLREQKHLDEGSAERAYWHYGSCSALRDALNLIQRSIAKDKA